MSNFNKSDLKTGHIVELRNKRRYEVMLNAEYNDITTGSFIISHNDLSAYHISSYCDDLTHVRNNDLDIMKVYKINYNAPEDKYLIYKRHEPIDLIDECLGTFEVDRDAITIEGFTIHVDAQYNITNGYPYISYSIKEVDCNSEIDHGCQQTLQDAVSYIMTKLAEKEG